MVRNVGGRSLQFRGPAYWNDLLPNVSSLKSGTTSRPLSFDLSDGTGTYCTVLLSILCSFYSQLQLKGMTNTGDVVCFLSCLSVDALLDSENFIATLLFVERFVNVVNLHFLALLCVYMACS